MSKTRWRLIQEAPATGAWNMAVDEALLQAGGATPVLRFYSWSPACISIGRFQDRSRFPTPAELVRRPSGGRAVWHQHEITYAVVLPESLLPRDQRSVLGAYQRLSRGFLRGLARLGIAAAPASLDAAGASANCFAGRARCDFLVRGQKLLGAAQCRSQAVVLQHGSLLMSIDAPAWQQAVGATAGMTSLEDLGVCNSREEVVQALCEGLRSELDADLLEDSLTEAEIATARHLHCSKYTNPLWNDNSKGWNERVLL